MTQFEIYIPSKARSEYSLTARALNKSNLKFKIVIEPQDESSYLKIFEKNRLLIMDKNNQGIAYVRSWIKRHSQSKGEQAHWQLDDNISNFRIRTSNKNSKVDAIDVISPIEEFYLRYTNIGICGACHTAFAFSKNCDIAINQQCYSAVLINNQNQIYWRPNLIEDTDYSLQLLYANWRTVLFNRLLIEKPTTMAIPGGNTDSEYSGNGRWKRTIGLINAWPKIKFKTNIKSGQIKVAGNQIWQTFPKDLIFKENQ